MDNRTSSSKSRTREGIGTRGSWASRIQQHNYQARPDPSNSLVSNANCNNVQSISTRFPMQQQLIGSGCSNSTNSLGPLYNQPDFLQQHHHTGDAINHETNEDRTQQYFNSNLTSDSSQLTTDAKYQDSKMSPTTPKTDPELLKSSKKRSHSSSAKSDSKRRRDLQVNPKKKKKYSCDVCQKDFSAKWNVERHMKEAHEGCKREKPPGEVFTCEVCNKEFSFKSTMTRHVRCHYDDRPYSCDFCDKKFVQSSDLNRHRTVHTGDKPFPCDQCDRAFTQSAVLARHLKYHETLKEKKIVYGKDMHYLKEVVDYKKLHDMQQALNKPSECSSSSKAITGKRKYRRTAKPVLIKKEKSDSEEDEDSDYSDSDE